MTPVEQALAYVRERGWLVFPCQWEGKRAKQPLLPSPGLHLASRDLAQIEAWWHRWPLALIGVPTGKPSGVVVFDIDVKPPKQPGSWQTGFDTLADLGRSILPETPMVHTVSDGMHLHFACNPAVEIRNSAGRKGLGIGLDVRGDGGYVIVPSPGAPYSWDPHWNYSTCAPLPAPAWLGHREKTPAAKAAFRPGRLLNPHAI